MNNVFARGGSVLTFLGRGCGGASRRRLVAAGSVLVVTVSLLSQVPARPVAAAAPAAGKTACPVSRPDVVSATVTARFCGGKVRVDGDESPTTEVFALPDGMLQAATALAPQRVRQPDGSWKPVNLTLQTRADGSVAPVISAFGVSMSGPTAGGDNRLVTVGTGSDQVGVDWSGALPAPVLAGNTATYVDVRPGVDVVVSATAAGIEQNVVIKSRAALTEIRGLTLPVVSKAEASFTADPSGNVALKDSTGRVFARAAGMQMWDAATDPASGQPLRRPLTASVSKLATKAGRAPGINLALKPDQVWLADPNRVFPITLDPTINPESTTFDTFVKQGSSSDFSGNGDLEFGTTSGNVTRSFLSWDMTGMQHATVSSATVNFYNFFSQSCTAAQWDLWFDTAAASASTTWTNQPAGTTLESTATATKGFSSSCTDGWVSISGTNFFQAAANTGASRGYMQLRAHDEGLTSIGFKQFRSRNAPDPSQVPYAVVTYTSTPSISAHSTVPSTACVTGSTRPYINTKTPTLKATVTQGTGATSTVNFEWWVVGGAKIGGASPTGIASGSTASAVVPAGAFGEGGNYMWRVDATSSGATSPWMTCEFSIDTIAPATAPTVSSTTYPAGAWSGNAGTAGVFTLGAAGVGDVNSYLYGLDANPPTTSITATALGGGASPSITPATNGPHTLYVQSVDRAGNKSPVTSYSFNVGAAALNSPTTGAVTAKFTQLQGSAPTGTTGVTYQWRRADTDSWGNIPTGDLTYTTGGGPVTGWPVAASGGTYPALNWNVQQTLANANTPSGLSGRWLLNETAGTTAADASGLGHPGTATAVTWSGDNGGSAAFNGSTSQIATGVPVMNTAGNFTVSAWVYLTSNTANNIVLSQNGSQQSGFDLRYQKSSNRWVFGRWNADIANAPTFITASSGTLVPALNTWTQLAASYTASTGLMTLYVNGVAMTATGTDTTPINAGGAFLIGHGEFNGAATSFFNGSISDVQTYNTVLTAAQIASIYTRSQSGGSAAALAGPLETRAVFTGGAGGNSPQTSFTFDPNLGSGASSNVGPGSVNLVTGALTVSASDVSVTSYGSDLTAARTFNTRQAAIFDSTHMFGPGWTSTATVANADAPYTGLTATGSLAQVGLPDGTTIGFTKSTTAGKYIPQIGQEDLALTYTSGSDSYTLTDQDSNVVTFTRISGAPAGEYTPTAITEPGSGQTTATSWQSATVDGVTVTRPTQLLAPVPAGVTCTTLVKGCRALTFSYATTTTATPSAWGDYAGRLQAISFHAWDPAAGSMTTVPVAQYLYNSDGRLVAEFDPRMDNPNNGAHLWATYAYNGDGTLSQVRPTNQSTDVPPVVPEWDLTYTTIPGDIGVGRLASASRSALTAGTATTTVVYDVPTSGTGAPYDMSATQTARWDEQNPPVQAAAIFDPGQIPTGNQTTGVMPTSWTRATITYMDANSRTVNTTTPGGYTTTTWYDQYGNNIQDLTANNRGKALGASTTDTPAQEAALADSESTLNTYDSTGTQLIQVLGPERDVRLSTGVVVRGRDLTINTYDQGASAGSCPCGLITTATTGARYWDSGGVAHDAEIRATTTIYDWTLRQPLVSTVDPAGLALTTRSTYDTTTGLTTSVTTPGGGTTTNTPATIQTIYYRPGTGSGYSECDNHPEWSNLQCRSQPGGQAASGPELPVTVTTYDMWNNPTVVAEKTSAGTLRTTNTTYDATERVVSTAVVGAAGTGTAIPATKNIYDPATGNLTNVQSVDSGGTVTAQTSTGYDALNRTTSYTDSDGVQSITNYDLISRPTSHSDGLQSATTSYDTGGENRGLATQIADAQAGTITGSHDPDGNLIQENWPNGIVVTHTYNETDTQTGITYTQTGCGQSDCTLYTETNLASATGQITSSNSSLGWLGYTYDNDGRLIATQDYDGGGCVTRVYGFGATAAGTASGRTSLATYDPASDGTCQTTTSATTSSWTYDTADRVNTTGYSYDSLGRTTTVPATDTQNIDGGDLSVAYNINDLVRTIQQGTNPSASYTIDVDNQRIRNWTDTSGTTHINHYNAISDSPSWTDDGGGISRDVSGLSGLVAIAGVGNDVDWQIGDIQGDIVATTNTGASLDNTSKTDEYGNLQRSDLVGDDRYAWLGAKQRAADNPDGTIVMGARLYNPATGRFVSTDPIAGGSASRYDYCTGDPTNCTDTSGQGQCTKKHFLWWTIKLCGVVRNISPNRDVLIAKNRCSHFIGTPCSSSPKYWLRPSQSSKSVWADTDSYRYYGIWLPVWDGETALVWIPTGGWS